MTQPSPSLPPRQRPEGRYGAPSRSGRLVLLAVVSVVVVTFLGWLAWAAWFHATPVVTSDLTAFEVIDEHQATALVDVALADDAAEKDVRCVVRALSEDHTPVGEKSFVPTDGRNEVAIRTERRATSVELVGCTAEGQPRPR